MNSKFGSLVANVSQPFKVELLDPVSEEVIRDKSGKPAFISVWSADSEQARDYDKAKRKDLVLQVKRSRNGRIDQDDVLEANIAKLAYLTDSWHLVDRLTGDVIDVPCTPENAADLYSPAGTGWIFVQAWVEANNPANFLPKPSSSSVPTPKPSSGRAAS